MSTAIAPPCDRENTRGPRGWDLQECAHLLCNNAPVNWDDLHVFLAVARAGRVSAAARTLGVEHTTVSRRLKALEETIGVPLFYRTATGYLLTSHGKNVLA